MPKKPFEYVEQVRDSTYNEQLKPIHPVSDHAADGAENETRGKFKEADEPEKKSRVGQLPRQPILDHEMYVLAGFSRKITDREKTKVAIAQRWWKSH